MSESKVISMEPVSMYEVRDVLKGRKAEKELTYEQDLTMKYVEKFAKLTEKQTTDLIKALGEIGFLKENKELLFQIAQVLPTRIEELQLIIPKSVEASDEDMAAVVELTQKFADKIE